MLINVFFYLNKCHVTLLPIVLISVQPCYPNNATILVLYLSLPYSCDKTCVKSGVNLAI